jgi:flagellar FliL protein
MSTAAATPTVVADAVPPTRGGKKKKLVLMIAIVVVLALLLAAGGGAMLWMKSKAAHAAEAADDDDGPAAAAKVAAGHADPGHPPTFLPLDMFVVNLADKDADRYAQVGIVLELENQAFADQMRAYMPAVRNAILMILAHKTSRELLEREGKEQLAAEIMRETVRPMGIEIPTPAPVDKVADKGDAAADDEVEKRPPKKSRKPPHNPVHHVHFSSFIIQ